MYYQIYQTQEYDTELGRTTIFKNADLEICPQPSTPDQVRLKNVTHDVGTFYYGATTCGPNEVTITTDVTHSDMVAYVIIFTRFKDKNSDTITDWDAGTTMKVVDSNTHRITLHPEELENYDKFGAAQMSYQFVATDKNDKITGRSLVFDDISLQICP